MPTPFDPGYVDEPFKSLCEQAPGESVYPSSAFRVEWGPLFHRGRLDGTARLLILGQDPSHNEDIVRRILVGEAGRRTQGFMAKLGITRSYVMINTFLYGVVKQAAGNQHRHDAAIAAYRHRWLDALLVGTKVEAVVALGALADGAWQMWKQTTRGQASTVAYAHITHPTQPESSSGHNASKLAAATQAMLANWNAALQSLKPAIQHPDHAARVPYGTTFGPDDKPDIPAFDLPAGIPSWMGSEDGWATRGGVRARIEITVPADALP